MNFHKTKKLLQMVSHDLGARNWQIVFHGIWNPRACSPITRMNSQPLPPSSASIVMIMSHSIEVAGLAHRKNCLTHSAAFWLEPLIKVTKSPVFTPLRLTQKEARQPLTVFIGLDLDSLLTTSKTPRSLVFFRLHWLERCPSLGENRLCSSKNLAAPFSKITRIYIY